MKFIIIVDNNDALTSITSDNIPAKLRRHLEYAMNNALDFDSDIESGELTPQITVGGISEADAQRLRFLDALEAYGVDNWEGYTIAYQEAYPEETEDTSDDSTSEAA